MKRSIIVAVLCVVSGLALGLGAGSVAFAHHGPMHRGVYRPVDAPSWFPWRVVVRCPGAAEDTWSRLTLVDVRGQGEPGAGDDVYVYRCRINV